MFYGIDPLAWAFCGFVIVPGQCCNTLVGKPWTKIKDTQIAVQKLSHLMSKSARWRSVPCPPVPKVYYGAVLKNAAQKYNIPISKTPPKLGGFVGKEAGLGRVGRC